MSRQRTCYTAFLNAAPTSTKTLVTPYGVGDEPLLTVAIIATRAPVVPPPPVAYVLACVDSGAHRSLFPLEIARRMGLAANELVKDATQAGGVGSVFDTWTSTIPITAMVVRYTQKGNQVVREPWGGAFELDPGFSALPQMLLGRADFFKAFNVTFNEHVGLGLPCFELTRR